MEASTRLALVSPGALRAYSAVLPAAGTALFARHASSLLGPVATATAPSPTHPPLHSALLRQRRRQQQQHQQLSARPFSQSARTPALNPYETAGGNAFGLSSSSSPSSSAAPGGPPVSYFSGRQSLPANTIIRFVPQQTAWIVERMGKFYRILEPGLAILIPFLDRIAYVKSLKETAIEIPSQNAITADNVTLELDGVLYTRVDDAYKASYGVEDAEYAISQLAQTTMRSEIGQLTLDHVLKERTTLNTNITHAINEAAQAWGVTCLRYEIRDIHAPAGVVEAMHRQVTAERSKRAEILESEGQRQSAINIAEGRKQSVILAAEALRNEKINLANGDAEAIKLKAEATARGIEAVADAIRAGQADAQNAISLSVAEKYVDAFGRLAKEGTAVVVPGNVGDLSGMIATAMAVYGKASEGQQKSAEMAARRLLEREGREGRESGEGEKEVDSKKALKQQKKAEERERKARKHDTTDRVLEGFEETERRRS